MQVQIDVSQMHVLNAERGVGMYTGLLAEYLKKYAKRDEISLVQKLDHQPVDIVHYPYFDLYFHTLPSKRRAKTVVTIHDVIPLIYPKQYKPGIRGSLAFWRQLSSLKSVDAVITDSECSKLDIAKHLGYPANKIHVVYLAGNPELKRESGAVVQKLRAAYHLPEKYVLYIGDINYNKNLPAFIEACSSLPADVSVVMVGHALNNIKIPEGKALHAALEKFHMKDRVVLLTNVPKNPASDLGGILSGAIAYVQPSLYEGFGLSVLDAMQCGTPVVTSRTSSLREVAGDAAMYFHPKNVQDIAEALNKTLSMSSADKTSLLQKAKHNLTRFSWDKTARETYAVYRAVTQA